jgi:uncharacterized protein (DUF1330 family)
MELGAALGAGLVAGKINGLVSPKEAQATQTAGAEKSAWVIGHIKVKDNGKWGQYRSRVPETLLQWGGEVLFRGHRVSVLSGKHSYLDCVVIRFPDAKSATGWYNSAAYQALIPIREQGADIVLVAFES